MRSLVYDMVWYPGEVAKMRDDDLSTTNGIHSYREHAGTNEWSNCDSMSLYCPLVIGTVMIWGDIIEHEHGYRSEFALINSIDYVLKDHMKDAETLKKLQKMYRVGKFKEA